MNNTFSKKSAEELAEIAMKETPNLKLLSYLGHLAPSVHNTQPWLIEINQPTNTLDVKLDPSKKLEHSDPTNRQTWISLGAFAQNIVYVAESLGFKTSIEQYSEGVILRFKLSEKYKFSKNNIVTAIDTILERQTNRRVFNGANINQEMYKKLQQSVKKGFSPKTILVKDRSTIDKLSLLSEKAVKLAFSSKDLRHELNEYINPILRPKDIGIPALALAPSLLEALWVKSSVSLGIFLNINARKEFKKIKSASALGLIFTKGDTKKDWLQTGLEYEKLCLELTRLGLAHSTNAVLVEAPDYHKEVGEIIGSKMRLQILVRIGYAGRIEGRSGRVPLGSILHVTNNPI
ncbi:hypothetical protein HZB74_00330 [Candidatus Saccharibacteria bacterium]|nr:hypothetical protein [Candidatus Saccharibacteria bacterium]